MVDQLRSEMERLAEDESLVEEIRTRTAEPDPEWISRLRYLTQENRHWEALLMIANRLDPWVQTEVVLAQRMNLNRVGILRKLCAQLPDGWAVYTAC